MVAPVLKDNIGVSDICSNRACLKFEYGRKRLTIETVPFSVECIEKLIEIDFLFQNVCVEPLCTGPLALCHCSQ